MYSVLWECVLSSRNESIYLYLCVPDYTMQDPEGLHEMKEELVKELKAKLTVPPDVRALLFLSVPKCGEIKLRSFASITTRIFVDRMTSTPLSKVDQMRTFRYVCMYVKKYVCTYLLLCVLQHLSVCVCLTVCSPDVIFIHLVCP